MLQAFFTIEEDDKEMPDCTGIDWLDTALSIASRLIEIVIIEEWLSPVESGYLENSRA